ncbi:MAG TPA: glycerol-3-phosphate dehydrogenase/oxidase [Acidimicrobiales bacterium]|nr:glycerol-3-phosphate dehydrogenase/oxidase [Acidimicrobiales bacterium]
MAFDREEALGRLASETFDVLVVGGGVTGAGVALDAASRGLTTALVERQDLAWGTSSRSSKMVHGGLRYLQQGEISLVRQALAERQTALRNAPHLVRVLPFMMPMHRRGGLIPARLAPLLRTALVFYDLAGGRAIGKRHRRLGRQEALAHMPTLTPDELSHAYLYYDARVDDARLAVALARTAALDHGAAVANYAPVVAVRKDGRGRAVGVTLDTGDGRLDVEARAVVNSGGVWVDDVNVLDEGEEARSMRPAKGVHVVVPSSLLGNDVAVIMPAGRGGSIFAVPWGDLTYVGTTDVDYEGSFDDLHCNADDVGYLLRHLNASVETEVTPSDVVGSWAGLRPLLRDAKSEKSADLSRRHRVTRSASGVVTVAGGKLTTYREMAEDAVDEVLRGLDRSAKCRTKTLPLRGARGHDQVDHRGLGAPLRDHLATRYGGEADAVIAMVLADRDLGRPLVPGLPYVRAEAVHAVRAEMAGTVDDVLSRRTRARLLARDASAAAADDVAALIGAELGWSAEERRRQVDGYRRSVAAEREALQAPAPVRGLLRTRTPEGGWVPGARPRPVPSGRRPRGNGA